MAGLSLTLITSINRSLSLPSQDLSLATRKVAEARQENVRPQCMRWQSSIDQIYWLVVFEASSGNNHNPIAISDTA